MQFASSFACHLLGLQLSSWRASIRFYRIQVFIGNQKNSHAKLQKENKHFLNNTFLVVLGYIMLEESPYSSLIDKQFQLLFYVIHCMFHVTAEVIAVIVKARHKFFSVP